MGTELEQEGQVSEQNGSEGLEGTGVDNGGVPAEPTKDWAQEYKTLEEKYKSTETEASQYKTYLSNLENIYQKDKQFARELERAIKGLPPTPAASAAAPAQQRQQGAPQVDPALLQKIQGLEQMFSQQQEKFQVQEMTSKVQGEWDQVKSQLGIDEKTEGEFWSRWQQAVQQDKASTLASNPSLTPKQAENMAINRFSYNLGATYRLLMEDKMAEFYANRDKNRSANLAGVNTPADRLKVGSTPGIRSQLFKKLQTTESDSERAGIISQLAKEMGVTPEELFAGTRMK